MAEALWNRCLDRLALDLSEQQLNTWVRPLQVVEDGNVLRLLAPNRYAVEWLNDHAYERIIAAVRAEAREATVLLTVGGGETPAKPAQEFASVDNSTRNAPIELGSRLNKEFTFAKFVEGASNQLARAAAWQVSQNPGRAYNPLFIYGGVGLGKTHLMQSVGNALREGNPAAKIAYVHAERFVGDMVRALQHNTINDFKRSYRGVEALLVDDIQFFLGKEWLQEEFFYTFNALLEGGQQIVLTCDRYPKDLNGLQERLKSRFGCGLVVAVEPPELETRVAIVKNKADAMGAQLPDEVAFFIAKRVPSNIRELEGALKRIIANAHFTGKPITLEFAGHALKDLFAAQQRLISLDNIKRVVMEYFRIRLSDLQGPSRSRSIVRPRQIAMSLAKELTRHSLPEIGDAFGGRDHTTVLHACRAIAELRQGDIKIREDYNNLLRTLTN